MSIAGAGCVHCHARQAPRPGMVTPNLAERLAGERPGKCGRTTHFAERSAREWLRQTCVERSAGKLPRKCGRTAPSLSASPGNGYAKLGRREWRRGKTTQAIATTVCNGHCLAEGVPDDPGRSAPTLRPNRTELFGQWAQECCHRRWQGWQLICFVLIVENVAAMTPHCWRARAAKA